MRAITGAVVSSEPCTLTEAHDMLSAFCRSHDSDLASSDCATYIVALDDAIKEHHKFLRRCGRREQQQGAAEHEYAHCNEVAIVNGGRERQKNGGGPQGSVEDAKVAVDAGERKSKKRNKEEELHDDKADGEILFEQRKEEEKHFSKELISVVKQEPDSVVEEDRGSERKKNKKKEKRSSKELVSVVKQEPDLVVEEDGGSERKNKKKKEKHSSKELVSVVKQEPDLVVEGDSKGIKEEEDKMAGDSDLNSRTKKKKKRGRGDNDGALQEQGEHNKKKRSNESRE